MQRLGKAEVSWQIKIKRRAEKEISSLPPKIRRQILKRIIDIEEQPRPHDSIDLAGEENAFRVDSGNYRILYHVNKETKEITIFRVRHRKDVYRGF